jgi:hypothetical protein
MLLSIALFSIQPCFSTTDDQNGDWSQKSVTLHDTPEADLMVRTGDIDNLGFGWHSDSRGYDIDPFSGEPTDGVPFQYWVGGWNTPDDPAGTDRIMVVSSFVYPPGGVGPGGADGYTTNTKRPDNNVEPIELDYTLPADFPEINSAVLQIFVNDLQAPSWRTKYQVTLSDRNGNEEEIPEMEEVLNSIDQSGATGQLVTIPIPKTYWNLIKNGGLSIKMDDPVTGIGDGYAIDFVKLLINLHTPTPNSHYDSMESFETLLRDQHNLLVSFNDLMGQTPATKEQKIEFLYSIEDLYRRQAVGMDKFSIWINENWAGLTPREKANVTASLEDLLRRQAGNLDAFNGNLLAWVKTFDPIYRQKFSDSFEDLLHRQVALLKNFERVLTQDGMQTPSFLASCEDLLRRQAQSLEGFGDLGQFTFNTIQAQEGPCIAIYKTADKTSLACGDNVTYKYTVYNNGDENVTDIQVTDLNWPGGPIAGTIPMLQVYQSKSIVKTVSYGCSPDVTYPIKVCNNATAKGKAHGETIAAGSNDVCVILNGPQADAEANCDPVQGYTGRAVTVQGHIGPGIEQGCAILTADDGTSYDLQTNDVTSEEWQEVMTVLKTGGCAEIGSCAYPGLPTTCRQGTPLYVASCKSIDCRSGPSCPDRVGNGVTYTGVDIDLVGPITLEGECFVLIDGRQNQYELEEDQNYPDAWNEVGTIEKMAGCAHINGCVHRGMPTRCPGRASCQSMSNRVSKPLVLPRYMRLFRRIHLSHLSQRRINRTPR